MQMPKQDWNGYNYSNQINSLLIKVKKYNAPILFVSHDGMWQFLCGKRHLENEARIVSLWEIYKLDSTVAHLSEMPCRYMAERESQEYEFIINTLL